MTKIEYENGSRKYAPSASEGEWLSFKQGSDRTLAVVAELTAEDRCVLELRYGINGEHIHSVEQVALLMGQSVTRVQNLEESAIGRVRSRLIRLARQVEA